MIVVFDAGNTRVKFGLFKDKTLIKTGVWDQNAQEYFNGILSEIDCVAYCSVLQNFDLSFFEGKKIIQINAFSKYPFKISYATPETLGVDRIVACAGAFTEYQDYLVIDIGTCVTYDLVTVEKGYEGGAISPGIQLRFKAMNNFTQKLPLVSEVKPSVPLVGTSTIECMQSGVVNSLTFEIEGFISKLSLSYPKLNVFLTGGDAVFFDSVLKSNIFAAENLVLQGIHSLIELNDQ